MFLKPGIADIQPLFWKGFFSVGIAIMAVTTSRTRNSRLATSKYLTVFSEKKLSFYVYPLGKQIFRTSHVNPALSLTFWPHCNVYLGQRFAIFLFK